MNKHGYEGVRMRRDGRAKPYYYQKADGGQRHATPGFTTAKEAAEAGKILRRILQKTRQFPQCTCTVSSHHQQGE